MASQSYGRYLVCYREVEKLTFLLNNWSPHQQGHCSGIWKLTRGSSWLQGLHVNILGPVIPFASYLLLPFKINYLLIFLCHFKLFFCAFYFHHILLSKYFFPSLSLPSLEEKWTIFHQNISFHLCTYPYIFWCFPFYKVALQPIKTQNFERFAWDWCDTK